MNWGLAGRDVGIDVVGSEYSAESKESYLYVFFVAYVLDQYVVADYLPTKS